MRIVEMVRHLEHLVENHKLSLAEREAAALAVNMLYRATRNSGIDWDSSTEALYHVITNSVSFRGTK